MSHAARRQPPENRTHRHPDRVIPIEKLETIAGAELERVSPRSPAEHREDHQAQRGRISIGKKHLEIPPFVSWSVAYKERSRICVGAVYRSHRQRRWSI